MYAKSKPSLLLFPSRYFIVFILCCQFFLFFLVSQLLFFIKWIRLFLPFIRLGTLSAIICDGALALLFPHDLCSHFF
jgi:hypothetical protein